MGAENTAPEEQPKQKQARPELATFLLKKGKASDRPKPPAHARRKQKDEKKKPEQDRQKHRRPKQKKQERKEVILSANVKTNPEDSPFAVLEQLKKQGNE